MTDFAYLAAPIRFNLASPLKAVMSVKVGAFVNGWDFIRVSLESPNQETRDKALANLGAYFDTCQQLTETTTAILGLYDNAGLKMKPVNELAYSDLRRVTQWAMQRDAFMLATINFSRVMGYMQPPEGYALGPLQVYVGATTDMPALAKAIQVPPDVVLQRVGECMAWLQQNPLPPSEPAVSEAVYNAVMAKLTQWRAALGDARRLEADAGSIITALESLLSQWRAAGNYPDQVRTLEGLRADTVANLDWARQIGGLLAGAIQAAETLLATGQGTLPADPKLPTPPPLPLVLPAAPGQPGQITVTLASKATSVPSLEAKPADVVQPRKTGMGWILTLATLLTLFN